MTIDLFAGPGGWDMGARILGIETPIHGYDIDGDACATATAAGFLRTKADVIALDPADYENQTGLIVSSPCPPFSAGGKGAGRRDLPIIIGAINRLGDSHYGHEYDAVYAEAYTRVEDPRSALVLKTFEFATGMPTLRWMAAEQVPAVADIWNEMAAELAATDYFKACFVVTLDGADFGLASHRKRTFLIVNRHDTPNLDDLPAKSWWACGRFEAPRIDANTALTSFPEVTMAQALGWQAGERINTRGARKTSGGNEFSADRTSWCLTEKARSWKRVSDGAQLTAAQAGQLTGFPADYPWQGSRSKQFLQAADVVSPPVAAAVLGAVLGIPWRRPVADYLAAIYPGRAVAGGFQPYLFEEVAA